MSALSEGHLTELNFGVSMFGHVHRAICSGGCQSEVLEEHALTRCVPAYKTDEADMESVGAGGRRRRVGERRRAPEGVGECR